MALYLDSRHKVNPRFHATIIRCLAALDAENAPIRGVNCGKRFDAGETMAFTRMLEHVQAEILEEEFPELMLRKLVPLDSSVPAGADTFKWRKREKKGRARWGVNGSDSPPLVTAQYKEEFTRIHRIEIGYQYTVDDLLGAQMAGIPLSSQLGKDARQYVEEFADEKGALGDSARGIGGLLKGEDSYGVAVQTKSGDGYTGQFNDSGATAATMLADLQRFSMSPWLLSKQIAKPSRLIIDTASYARIATTPVSDLQPDTTVLEAFLKSTPFVREVIPWLWADAADTDNDGPRWVLYQPTIDVCRLIFPVDYRELPPQPVNFDLKIPAFARFGGVVIEKPLHVAYLDGMRD